MSGAPWTKGAYNAAKLGDEFTAGNIEAGTATFVAASATDVITPTITGIPTFVMAFGSEEISTYTINGTTGAVTFTRITTTGAATYSYIIGILA